MSKKIITAMTAATLAASMVLTGCGSKDKIDPNATLVSVGEEEVVSMGYGNFVAKYNQAVYDQIYVSYFGSVMWDQEVGEEGTMEDSVKKQVMDDLERYYVSNLHASDYDVAITDEQQADIEAAAKKFLEDNDKEAIEQMGATEEYLIRFLQEQTVAQLLADKVKAEAEVNITDEEAIQSTVSYVLYASTSTDDQGNATELSKEELVALKENAEKLAAAEDFAAEAEAQEVTAQKYSYTKASDAAEDTTLGEDVITAAKALKDGETSAVIEVEGKGYYVVHMEATEDEEATATKRENLEKDARNTYYNDKISAWEEDVDWKVDDEQWSKVTFEKYFSMAETKEDTAEETTTEE